MLRQASKKMRILFFAIAALMSCGFTKPMFNLITSRHLALANKSKPQVVKCLRASFCDCIRLIRSKLITSKFFVSRKSHYKTTITDLPHDCLCEICQFADIKLFHALRLVCKEFNQAAQQKTISLTIKKEEEANFPDDDLSQIGNIKGLTICGFDCFDLSTLKNLKYFAEHLDWLSVRYNKHITGLDTLENLRVLKLLRCFSFSLLELVGNSLEEIEVTYCKGFNDQIPYLIGTNVHTLRVKKSEFDENGVLLYLPKIRNLTLSHLNYDWNLDKRVLSGLHNLHTLKLRGFCDLTGEGLENLKKLHTLEIKTCPSVHAKWLPESLVDLKVKFAEDFTGDGLENLKNLKNLKMKYCRKFKEEKLKNLNLCTLEMGPHVRFTGSVLEDLKKLSKLVLMRCDDFDEKFLSNLDDLCELKVTSS